MAAHDTPARSLDWDVLAAALNHYGIRHVAPQRRRRAESLAPEDLFYRLAQAPAVRLQEAAMALLLTHPELAHSAQAAIQRLEGVTQDRAKRRYVAAAAFQRMWRTRLETDLGPRPLIPAVYLDELALPPLDQDYGRATLRALAAQEEALYGFNAWAGYTSLMDLLLNEIQLRGWGTWRARAS